MTGLDRPPIYIPQGKYFYLPAEYLYFKPKDSRFHQNFNQGHHQNKSTKFRRNYGNTNWRSKAYPKLRYKQIMKGYWDKRLPKKNHYHDKINLQNEDQMYPAKTTQLGIIHYGIENALNGINNQPVRRLFDKPLIASQQAALSSECVTCDKKGMDCMLVRTQFLTSLNGNMNVLRIIYIVTHYIRITKFFFIILV